MRLKSAKLVFRLFAFSIKTKTKSEYYEISEKLIVEIYWTMNIAKSGDKLRKL